MFFENFFTPCKENMMQAFNIQQKLINDVVSISCHCIGKNAEMMMSVACSGNMPSMTKKTVDDFYSCLGNTMDKSSEHLRSMLRHAHEGSENLINHMNDAHKAYGEVWQSNWDKIANQTKACAAKAAQYYNTTLAQSPMVGASTCSTTNAPANATSPHHNTAKR